MITNPRRVYKVYWIRQGTVCDECERGTECEDSRPSRDTDDLALGERRPQGCFYPYPCQVYSQDEKHTVGIARPGWYMGEIPLAVEAKANRQALHAKHPLSWVNIDRSWKLW